MKTLEFTTAKELKKFTTDNREKITNINGVEFKPLYPLLTVSNTNAFYYDVNRQDHMLLIAPYKVTTIS